MGYADDTVIFATSLAAVTGMHDWIRKFFRAHSMRLNCGKTELLCSRGSPAPVLRSVDGGSVVVPKGEDHTCRRTIGLDFRGTDRVRLLPPPFLHCLLSNLFLPSRETTRKMILVKSQGWAHLAPYGRDSCALSLLLGGVAQWR